MNGEWISTSRTFPCPICNKTSWCCVSSDGGTVICRREPNGAIRTKLDKSGTEYYLHRIGSGTPASPRLPSKTRSEPERAAIEDLHQVYTSFLEDLILNDEHRRNLLDRGLPPGEIEKRNYKTLHAQEKYDRAKELVKRFGEELCSQIPGLGFRKVLKESIWNIHGCVGSALLIPSRNLHGQIEAIKARPDNAEPGKKYVYLSSRSLGGPSPGARVHVPVYRGGNSHLVRVTEGELKADVATILSGILTLSIPGVQSWRLALPILKQMNVKTVRLAFDADASENIFVARSLRNTMIALQNENLNVEVETWN